MKRPTLQFIGLSVFFCTAATVLASDWPGFRGPMWNGVSPDSDLPVKWTADNFLWKIKLPGPGGATPITSGDKVFVVCYTGYGTSDNAIAAAPFAKGKGKGANLFGKGNGFNPGGKGNGFGPFGQGNLGKGQQGFGKGAAPFAKGKGAAAAGGSDQSKLRRVVVCVDGLTGTVLWQKEVEPKLPELSFSEMVRDHGYTTNTPVTDGKCVYVFFGKTGVLAFDFAGNKLWHTDVGSGTFTYGSAASLALYKNLVIVNASVESKALIALDKTTGKEVWRVRGPANTWSSPILVQTKDGKDELVLSQPGKVVAYEPESGKELWQCQGLPAPAIGGTYNTPVAKDGIVYVAGGGGPGQQAAALAVRTGGRGDVSKTHVVWRVKAGTNFNSPVISGDYLYCIDGTVTCLRLDTGKVAFRQRLYDSDGEYPSPVIAGDKLFALTRADGLYVLAAGGKFQSLAHNAFQGDSSKFNASPAIGNGRMYVRSNAYLYCIGKK